MVQQSKQATQRDKQAHDSLLSNKKQANMSAQKKDNNGTNSHKQPAVTTKKEPRGTNGHVGGFRTDTAISGNRVLGTERELQPWQPDDNDTFGFALESSSMQPGWDQFATHENAGYGTSTYDESFYTTAINKNAPDYQAKLAFAERKEREILRSTAKNSHVREERNMNFKSRDDNGQDEEDKYSGVLGSDFPPLVNANKASKYVAPARRMPTGSATVKGAPVDPAIISAQLSRPSKIAATTDKSTPLDISPIPTTVEDTTKANAQAKNKESPRRIDNEVKEGTSTMVPEIPSAKATTASTVIVNVPQLTTIQAGNEVDNTSTHIADASHAFKRFAQAERDQNELRDRSIAQKKAAEKDKRLKELKKFNDDFMVPFRLPEDLIPIIARDPVRQREIAEKSRLEQEQRVKHSMAKPEATATSLHASPAPLETQAVQKSPSAREIAQASVTPLNRHQSNSRNINALPHGMQQGVQQQFQRVNQAVQPQSFQAYSQHRNIPGSSHNARVRNLNDSNSGLRHNNDASAFDSRLSISGPVNGTDTSSSRRSSAALSSAKLNPHTQEFRPSASAQPFNPGNSAVGTQNANAVVSIPPVKRFLLKGTAKPFIKADFDILARLSATSAPSGTGSEAKLKAWTANGNLQPAYDTLPTWKVPTGQESDDANIKITYTELLSKPAVPFVSAAYQHQLPFHLQQGAQNSRNVQRIPGIHHIQSQHNQFNNSDDHRMVASHSASSFASPRMQAASMAYTSPMGPGQGYQSAIPFPSSGPQTPQMNYRAYSHVPYSGPIPGPVVLTPQMPMPYMHPSGQMFPAPLYQSPSMMGAPANGYHSPGRGISPMMMRQGSQQGYQMGQMGFQSSPAMGYQTPVYAQGPPSQTMRSFQYQQYSGSPMQRQHSQGNRAGNLNRMGTQLPAGQSSVQSGQSNTQQSTHQTQAHGQVQAASPSHGDVADDAK